MPLADRVEGRPLVVVQPHVRLGDPHVASDDRHRLALLHALYEPLVRRGPAGSFVGALATSWTVAPDAREWAFRLRSDIRSHDGRPVTAHDVVANLVRVRDEPIEGELGTTGVYRGYLAGCEIAAMGDEDLTVRTPRPMADLLDVLVELFVVPERHLACAAAHPAGTGPFRLVDVGRDEVVLEAFGSGAHPRPLVDRVRWIGEPVASARVEMVREGWVDVASDVPPRTSGVATRWQPGSVATTFMFDVTKGATADVRVRRALNYAVDVPAIVEALFAGRAEPTSSPCTPTQLGYDPDLAPYAYDPDRARALLVDAQAQGLSLTFDIPARLPDEAPRLAELVGAAFADVGVDLRVVEHADRGAYAEAVRDKRIHDAACFDSSPHSTFRLFNEKFHAGVRGLWWLGFEDPAFDALVDRARATVVRDERRALYRQAARRLHDGAPWLFLYGPHLGWGVSDRAAVWSPSPDGLVTLSSSERGPS